MNEPPPVAIAVAVVEHEGRFLIGLRPPGAALAGYWEFPGGKVLPHETAAEAAARECAEETGVVVNVVREMLVTEHAYPHGHLRLHFFDCGVVSEPAFLPSRFEWVTRDELAKREFPPANADLLAMIAAGGA